MSKAFGLLQLIAVPGYVITAFDVHAALWETDWISVILVWFAVATMCGVLIRYGLKWINE